MLPSGFLCIIVSVHNHYSARCFQNENPSSGTRQKQFIAFVCIIHDCEEQSSEQLCIIICKDIL